MKGTLPPEARFRIGRNTYAASLEREIRRKQPCFSIPIPLLRTAAQSPALSDGMLALVDVFARLDRTDEKHRFFRQCVGVRRRELSGLPRIGVELALRRPFRSPAVHTIEHLITRHLAPHFIVQNRTSLERTLRKYRREESEVSVDFLSEAVISEAEAERCFETYIRALSWWKHHSEAPRHISVKLSALYPFCAPYNHEESVRRTSARLAAIVAEAHKGGIGVTVDAEQYELRHVIESAFCSVALEYPDANLGIALQAYRKDAHTSAEKITQCARDRGAPITIRLVKGATWDTDIALADKYNWQRPLYTQKAETDTAFNRLFDELLAVWGTVYVSPATHNPHSIAHAYMRAENADVLDDEHFCFQTLYGLGEPVRRVLASRGMRVLVYTPFSSGNAMGDMAFFVRRIRENTANTGFLYQLLS